MILNSTSCIDVDCNGMYHINFEPDSQTTTLQGDQFWYITTAVGLIPFIDQWNGEARHFSTLWHTVAVHTHASDCRCMWSCTSWSAGCNCPIHSTSYLRKIWLYYWNLIWYLKGFPGGSAVKNLPVMQEIWVRSLGGEDPLEEDTATHSSILAWRILWTEEPSELQSMGSQRVRHNWSDQVCARARAHTHTISKSKLFTIFIALKFVRNYSWHNLQLNIKMLWVPEPEDLSKKWNIHLESLERRLQHHWGTIFPYRLKAWIKLNLEYQFHNSSTPPWLRHGYLLASTLFFWHR